MSFARTWESAMVDSFESPITKTIISLLEKFTILKKYLYFLDLPFLALLIFVETPLQFIIFYFL